MAILYAMKVLNLGVTKACQLSHWLPPAVTDATPAKPLIISILVSKLPLLAAHFTPPISREPVLMA